MRRVLNAARTLRIAIYARISDDAKKIRNGAGGRNVGEQVADSLAYVGRVFGLVDVATLACEAGHLVGRGKTARWVPDPGAAEALVVIFRENDRSAYKREATVAMDPVTEERYETFRVLRPVWAAMMRAARNGEVSAVVGLDLDRYLRDPLDLEDAILTAEHSGVAWHEVTSSDMALHTSTGQLMARMRASMKRSESDSTSRRVSRAHERRIVEGKPLWIKRPFGHHRDGSLHDVEADAIVQAAERVLRGATLADLTRSWNEAGLTTTGGHRFDPRDLGNLFRQARLAGLLEHYGEVVGKGTFAPVLSEATWRALVAELNGANGGERGRRRGYNKSSGRLSNVLASLTDAEGTALVAMCGECGAKLTQRWMGGKDVGTRYYQCVKGCVVCPADLTDVEIVARASVAAGTYGVHLLATEATPDTGPLRERKRDLAADLELYRDGLRTGAVTVDGETVTVSRATALRQIGELEADLASVQAELDQAERKTTARPVDLPAVLADWGSLDLGEQRSILARVYQRIAVLKRYADQSSDVQRVVTRFRPGWLPDTVDPVLLGDVVGVGGVVAEADESGAVTGSWSGAVWLAAR